MKFQRLLIALTIFNIPAVSISAFDPKRTSGDPPHSA